MTGSIARCAKADEGGTCNNPSTGEPDVAPTAPQSVRNVFAVLVPPLAQPVSAACLEAIRSEDRTYLGKRQLRRFLREIRRSDARFKVVMNELRSSSTTYGPTTAGRARRRSASRCCARCRTSTTWSS